jgi:hypothetical protein
MTEVLDLLTNQLNRYKEKKIMIANAKATNWDAIIKEYEDAIALLKGA